jgi:hypothetical protein
MYQAALLFPPFLLFIKKALHINSVEGFSLPNLCTAHIRVEYACTLLIRRAARCFLVCTAFFLCPLFVVPKLYSEWDCYWYNIIFRIE